MGPGNASGMLALLEAVMLQEGEVELHGEKPAVVAEAALEPNPANPPQARPKRPAAAAKPDGNPDKH